MRRQRVRHNIIVLWVMICCIGVITMASMSTVTSEQGTKKKANATSNNKVDKVKKSKKKKTGKFVTKNGNTYYKISGKYVKNKFLKIGKKTYHFDENGVMTKGWMKYKGDYYYFNRSNGKMAKKCRVDGVYIYKSGKAKNKDAYVEKIQTMIKARKQMEKICKPTDTKKEKLRKCFDWVAKAPYKRYRFLNSIYKQKGWEVDFANDIFDHGDGCCVSEAAALAFLVHECGYKTVYVAHDSEHAWMELNGKVYDTLFARSKDYNKYYALSYSNYNCHAIDKRKI